MSHPRRPAPIETAYEGRLFRSRLEARWAVFLDALEVEWEYEREGYALPSGWYLPDFWLPRHRAWLEIKGDAPSSREEVLASELARHTGSVVYLFFGDMDAAVRERNAGGYAYRPDGTRGERHLWHECPTCWTLNVVSGAAAGYHRCGPASDRAGSADGPGRPHGLQRWTPRLEAAYGRATRARFEHGATPGAAAGRGPSRPAGPPARGAAPGPVSPDGPPGEAPDGVLDAVIRRWRGEVAREERIPAYVIFPDRALEELVRRRPRSLAALVEVRGLGPAKVDRYGPRLLARMWDRPASAFACAYTPAPASYVDQRAPARPTHLAHGAASVTAPVAAPAPAQDGVGGSLLPPGLGAEPSWWQRVARRLGGG